MTRNSSEQHHRDRLFDSGDMLCGELALKLRSELKQIESGQVLEVVARDPAAPQDLPAWCQLTGHAMLHMAPPHFWIRRK